jgi:glycosyltransferase involved in cell wall biosynthesis
MNNSICFIVQNYYDIDPRVRRKAEAAYSAGFLVDVIALRPQNRKEREYSLNGINVLAVGINKKRASTLRYILEYLWFFIYAFFKVSVLMLKKRYQAIDVNTLPDFLVFSALIPKILGAKIILDMHEVMPEFYMSKFEIEERHWMIRLIRFQELLSMKFADEVIVINEPIQELLQARGLKPSKTTVILNSVDENLFFPKQKDHSPKDSFIMMYHGTLTPIYGLDIALSGFATVYSQMPKSEFWIIGEGPDLESLKALVSRKSIEQRVKFIGSVTQQEIPDWLMKCDVGVLATRQDIFLDLSFSNKLPEYIVMKKPVIISRLKTIRHYFSEEALAFFDPQNEIELGQRMLELYQNPFTREKLARRALMEYKPINWSLMRDRYLTLIKSTKKIELDKSINCNHLT